MAPKMSEPERQRIRPKSNRKIDSGTKLGSDFGRLRVIDSHTGGEPTRLIVSGVPKAPAGSMADRLEWFKAECDHVRRALVNEPRGSDVVVGGALFEPNGSTCDAGVLYFNNVGYLGMCVHGTIGLMVTLGYLG